MADPSDVQVIQTISVQNDVAPITRDIDNSGGYRTVADSTERDAIPATKRVAGMMVFTRDTDQLFTLDDNLTDWTEFSGGSGTVSPVFVQEALTIPIDQKDVGARVLGDPSFPIGTKFRTQAEVTAALAGATAFGHWMDVLDSLAGLICPFRVTLDATGISDDQFGRAGDTEVAFDFSRTVFTSEGAWQIDGPSSSTWPVVSGLSSLAITVVQAGSNDPFITTSGTPFTAGALKGLFCRLSTGQLARIHDNDTSTIRLRDPLSPTPIVATDTFDIVRPFALINTDDGVAQLVANGSGEAAFKWSDNRATPTESGAPAGAQVGEFFLQDIGFDNNDYTGTAHLNLINGSATFLRCHFDHDVGGVMHLIKGSGVTRVEDSAKSGAVSGFSISFENVSASLVLSNAVVIGDGNTLSLNGGNTLLIHAVIEGGRATAGREGAVFVNSILNDSFGAFWFDGGKQATIRRSGPTSPGLHAARGTKLQTNTWGLRFEDCNEACILLTTGAELIEPGDFFGLTDGGGNTDVGIDIQSGAKVSLAAGLTDVAGSAGAVRIGGTIFATIGDAITASPVLDLDSLSILRPA